VTKKEVLVAGGGIAGLSAALVLQEEGVDYHLFEAQDRLGGKILTERVEGFLLEGGPDCFLSERPGVFELARRLEICHRLLPTEEQNRGTFILWRGRLHPLPEGLMLLAPSRLGPFLKSGLLSWRGKLRALAEPFVPRGGGGDESLASFVRRRLGEEVLERIAEPLIAGIHAGDPETMSLRAGFPRFARMEEEGGLIRSLLRARRSREKASHPCPGGPEERTFFMSFAGGMGELVEEVAGRLSPSRITRGVGVKMVTPSPGGWEIELQGGERISARAVVLALPAYQAARVVEEADPELAGLLSSVPFSSTLTLSLAYREGELPPLSGFGFVVPRKEGKLMSGVTYSSRKWRGRVPSSGYVLLRVFARGGEELSDHQVVSRVREELAEILGVKARPLLTRLYRWPRGLPQYPVGHLQRLEQVERRLGELPGLFLAGASYRGVGVGECIRSGFSAARGALELLRGPGAAAAGLDSASSAG